MAYRLTAGYMLSVADSDRSILHVAVERCGAVAVVDRYVIAAISTTGIPQSAVVRAAIVGGSNYPGRCRDHFGAQADRKVCPGVAVVADSSASEVRTRPAIVVVEAVVDPSRLGKWPA